MDTVLYFSQPARCAQLQVVLSEVETKTSHFWGQFSDTDFFAPHETQWTPAENVEHLNRSTRPVAHALRLPKLLPRLLFGRTLRGSRSYAEVRQVYQQALASGGQAGRYAPKRRPPPAVPAAARDRTMSEFDSIWRQLHSAVKRWNDDQLDSLRCPTRFWAS